MSLLKATFFPRSLFDVDLWSRPVPFGPSALDIFDPFDDLDMVMNNSLNWLTRPDFIRSSYEQPKIPQKYRVSVDCAGYSPNSIKTNINENKLVITGQEGEDKKHQDEDFSIKHFKKTFDLPKDVQTDQMASFLTTNGQLVVEIPRKQEKVERQGDVMTPQIVDTKDGGKEVKLQLALPDQIDASQVSITAKDRDVIVKGEYKDTKPDSRSQVYYYRRSTMPENTDMSQLKCSFENNQVLLNAPVLTKPQIGAGTSGTQQKIEASPGKEATQHSKEIKPQ